MERGEKKRNDNQNINPSFHPSISRPIQPMTKIRCRAWGPFRGQQDQTNYNGLLSNIPNQKPILRSHTTDNMNRKVKYTNQNQGKAEKEKIRKKKGEGKGTRIHPSMESQHYDQLT
jgi:hypothetical protein